MRNGILMQLIGDLIHMFGRKGSTTDRVEEHYGRHRENIRSPLDENNTYASSLRRDDGMHKKLVDSFSPEGQQAFNALGSEHQREGFLIVRAFAGAARATKGKKIFQSLKRSPADRLSITLRGAADVIRKLCECESKVIAQTPALC